MTPEAQRIALAQWAGWKFWHDDTETLLLPASSTWPILPHFTSRGMRAGDGRPSAPLIDTGALPDYLNDLNAVHELEERIPFDREGYYGVSLMEIVIRDKGGIRQVWHATAAQRCEALLRTLGLWEEQ